MNRNHYSCQGKWICHYYYYCSSHDLKFGALSSGIIFHIKESRSPIQSWWKSAEFQVLTPGLNSAALRNCLLFWCFGKPFAGQFILIKIYLKDS